MSQDDPTFELTRRKALAGLGTIGVASAGAGLGTSAFFSDTESFEDNSLTAGELDLAVEATIYENQGQAGSGTFTEVQDGDTSPSIEQELSDVKPGDYSCGKFCFSIVDNPGYIWAGGELTANDENEVTEPEADDDPNNSTVDPDGGIDGSGELADAIEVTLFYAGTDFDPSDKGRPSETDISSASFSEGVIFEGTLRETLAYLGTGVPLDANPDPSERDAFTGAPNQSFDEDVCLGFAWEVPTSVGNEIQADSVEFDLTFEAVQERHNDGTANPFADAVLTSDPASNGNSFITASVNAGPTTVIRAEIDNSAYRSEQSDQNEPSNGAFPTDFPRNPDSYQVEVNIDADTGDDDTLGESGPLGADGNDDFRFGYAGPDADPADVNGSNAGGYLARNTSPSNSGFPTDNIAGSDISGFTAIESSDQTSYIFIIDWDAVAGDSVVPDLPSAPSNIIVNEVFASDGGGIFASGIDGNTDPSGSLSTQ